MHDDLKTITVPELKQRLGRPEKPLILDVRQPEEFAEGHIDGAILIPLNELPARLGELVDHRADEIVVNCKSGGRSAVACEFLMNQGFTNVANLVGGILAWRT